MIAAGAKSTKPMRSSALRCEIREDLVAVLMEWLGMWMKKRKTATRPPAGRLI
jgi:hypothetical protein